ncbi:MAG: 30S ribosomal protein S4 [Synergistaceae bacterium]|nr:30S ribosomal protein S4 [Synergistota bacterium]NLM71948.1 30S ribosomal protein S4 [Synergistaceae bacterium]
MSRYIGPSCRLCKAEGTKLFLKGDRCYTAKCAIVKKEGATVRGRRGRPRSKISEYGIRLREKQKLRRFYGMTETQFKRFFTVANKQKGQTGHNFLALLERRLDNVVYRLGLGNSRKQARQLVLHGHFRVNGRRVDIPSFLVDVGDVVAVMENSRDIALIKENAEVAGAKKVPDWLELNAEKIEGKVISLPAREQIDAPVTEQLVVEFYAR